MYMIIFCLLGNIICHVLSVVDVISSVLYSAAKATSNLDLYILVHVLFVMCSIKQ